MQPESMTNHNSDSHYYTGATPSLANTAEPPGDIATTINLQLKGALEQLQQASIPRRELPSVALGVLPSARETEDPLGP